MAQYIYARVSTKDQNLEGQVDELISNYPDAEVHEEKASAKSMDRPLLNKLLSSLISGDSLIVYDMSRLNRNTKDFLELLESLDSQGIGLIIHNMGGQVVDSTSATGKLILTVMSAIETMNRELMLEKQAHGIAANIDKFKGRQANPETAKKCERALELIKQGNTKEEAARAVKVGVATLYRYINANKSRCAMTVQ